MLDHPSPSRVVRYHSDEGQWTLVTSAPHPQLRSCAREYQGYVETTIDPIRRRELPTGDVTLIINFGPAYRVLDPETPAVSNEFRSFVAGVDDSYSLTESTGAAHCMQVNFTPIGARRFFGLPMHEIAQRVVTLEDILGSMASRLEEQLYDAPNWDDRFSILDSVITTRLKNARTPPPGIVWAWNQLLIAGGDVSIRSLATEIGCSQKHLIAQFREYIGLPPKKMARVLRFNRVIRCLGDREDVGWAEIAHDSGYYDQAHFIRDFRQFSGDTPGDFLKRRMSDPGGYRDTEFFQLPVNSLQDAAHLHP